MQNIFYIGYPLSDAGAPHQAMAALYLAKQGHRVVFFAWGNAKPPGWLAEYPSLEYQLIPKKGLLSAFKYLLYLVQSFFQYRSDINVVYVQGAQQTPFLFWLPWVKGKCKSIYHTQDYLEPGRHPFYESFELFFAKRADWVISNEPNRARFMASNYRLKKMPEVIRTALPSWYEIPERDENYRQQLLQQAGLEQHKEPRLIVAGGAYRSDRMGPQLLNAFAQLPENYGLVFTWMPSDSLSRVEFERQMQTLGLKSRVVFLGSLGFLALLRLYICCDIGILLYPNSGVGHFYQAPGRLTEYLRCGLPIVTSNFPGLELLVLKYNVGEVTNPYRPEEIEKACLKLGQLSNEELWQRQKRLIDTAKNELVYEIDAEKVFSKIFTCS